MSVADTTRSLTALRLSLPRLRLLSGTPGLVAAFIGGTVLLRLPSFFEPPWHADEGIFAAVAQAVVSGGQLYADAWEAKPPLFIYIYVAVIEVFGAGVLPLRIATAASAIGAELALFGVAQHFMSRRQALAAAVALACFLAVPFWEGTLALADTFVVLPSTLAVLLCLNGDRQAKPGRDLWWTFAAGVLFGAAFLIRPTSAVVAIAVVTWLLATRRPWFWRSLAIGLGTAAFVLPVVAAFALFGSFYWFWDANIGFFFDYVPSGQQLPFHQRPLIIGPAVVTLAALLWYRLSGRETPRWSLPVLWLTLTLAVALLTGRPYSHYFLQIFPPLSLVLALLAPALTQRSWRPRWQHAPGLAIAGTVAALWLVIVAPAFQGNLLAMHDTKAHRYYVNFVGRVTGLKSETAYNNYFDRRVNLTHRLDATLAGLGAEDEAVYIWGEVAWAYALAESEPATRYMTSFYALLLPDLDTALGQTLADADPRFIVVLGDVWPRLDDASGVIQRRYAIATRAVYSLIAWRYQQVAVVGRARIFERTQERALIAPPAPERVDAASR